MVSDLDEGSAISGPTSSTAPSNKLRVKIRKQKRQKPVFFQLLMLFLTVKTVIVSLALISAAMVVPSNTATNLILGRGHVLSSFDKYLKQFLTPFIRWDAIHILAIARDGYIFENQFAFFPLLPATCSLMAKGLLACGLGKFVAIEALIGISAFILTNACHYLASLLLFK